MRLLGGFQLVLWRRGIAALAVAMLVWAVLPAAIAQAAPGTRVDLRVLLLADGNSQTAAIATQMDREGVPYTAVDLADPGRPIIDDAFLADSAQGHGRFQAIVMPNQFGGLSEAELAAVADYERSYGVRHVNAYVYPGATTGQASPTFSGTLDGAAATTTEAGLAGPFTYLNGPLTIDNFDPSVAEVYGYLAQPSQTLPAGADFTPLVEATLNGQTGTLVGVYTHDFREELNITASYNSNQQWFNEIAHGVVTWMTRGLHLGYHRNYFSVQVDDVFMGDGRWNSTLNCTPGDVVGQCEEETSTDIRMIPSDVARLSAWQAANGFTFDMVFNAQGSVDAIEELGGPDPLTDALLAAKDEFVWVNHTYSHTFLGCIQIAPTQLGESWRCATPADSGPYYDPALVPDSEATVDGIRWLSQAKIESQVALNQQWATAHGLPNYDPTALVTGEHAGLLTEPQQPIDNPYLAPALAATGIAYTGSDASRETESRLVQGGSTMTVPRHPMNIFYNVATYGEEVDEYNWIYTSAADGGSGLCTANPETSTCITPLANANPSEAEASFRGYIVPIEVRNAFRYVITNDPRPFYAHQSNFAEDAVLLPAVEGVLDEYEGAYDVAKSPLITTDLVSIGQALNRMTSWTAAQDDVTAYVDSTGVHVSGPEGTTIPLTVPTGTTLNGPSLSAYDGELSGWFGASGSDSVVAETATAMGGYIGHAAPAVPDVSVTGANASAMVNWTLPGGDGNSPVTGFGVDYSSDGGDSWSTAVAPSAGVIATNFLVTGLTNGTPYVFRVNAANAVGVGEWSSASSAVTPQPTVPGTVTGVTGSSATSTSIELSWTAPDNGGAPISEYAVLRSSNGGTSWIPGTIYVTGNPAPTTVAITGLTPGTQYVFRVAAKNATGWGPRSATSAPVGTAPAPLPAAVTGVVASNATSTSLDVSWTAPEGGVVPVLEYAVLRSSNGGQSWLGSTYVSGSPAATSVTLTGLTPGTQYVFRVAAKNATGWGPRSATSAPVGTTPAPLPAAVTGVVASNATSTSLDVSWTAPGGGVVPVLEYAVLRSSNGGQSWLGSTYVSGSPAATSVTLTGLTPGTQYVFRVAAKNATGWGPRSATSAPVGTIASAPTAPTSVAGVAGNASVSLTWAAPTSTGGSPVTGYGVDFSSDSGASWSTAIAPAAGLTARNYTVTGLTNGTAYVFRVVAANAVGSSGWSATSASYTPPTLPARVTGVAASNATSTSLGVTWTAPDGGGAPILEYAVLRSTNGGASWIPGTVYVTGSPAPTSVTLTGLTPGTQYVFQVAARNATGWGPRSAISAPAGTLP
ncbi:fibronectin type III domain-containing protein [Demequina aurantiaca]|uniref:fibronectin type III domain-containing protein n=1 Tax=Demequina aurantiaca TaxID=676200 RepID=UPI003D34B79A